MPARFINLGRQTPMFLPCDRREWISDDHLVHFIVDAVEPLPLGHFHVNPRGPGSEQYPPAMRLALLIYCYATGRFGSRTMEAATCSDGAVRDPCANTHPDHDSICPFRANHETAFRAAFARVLPLARELRRAKLGGGVDGPKIQANARQHAAVSDARAGGLIAQLEREVGQFMERAQPADAPEGREALDIAVELKRRESRKAARQKARQVIEERAKEAAAAQQAEYPAKVAARPQQRAAGKKPRGQEPPPPRAEPDPKAQCNFTDPESRIMKAGNGQHFQQAYNAPAAVDGATLIAGQRARDAPNDKEELAPSAAAAAEQKEDGTPSGLTVYAAVEKHSHHQTVEDLLPRAEPAAPGPEAGAQEKTAHRLKTAAGQALYKLRKQTVEPAFGIIQEVMGFRRFLLRGRRKGSLEWTLVCLSYNLQRLFGLNKLARAG